MLLSSRLSDAEVWKVDTYIDRDPSASKGGDPILFAKCFTVFKALFKLFQRDVPGHLLSVGIFIHPIL